MTESLDLSIQSASSRPTPTRRAEPTAPRGDRAPLAAAACCRRIPEAPGLFDCMHRAHPAGPTQSGLLRAVYPSISVPCIWAGLGTARLRRCHHLQLSLDGTEPF